MPAAVKIHNKGRMFMKRYLSVLLMLGMSLNAQASLIGYADVVLDYFDSGAGPISGPYGGTYPGSYPVPVSTSVVLGNDPGASVDFLSLPKGSYVTVGFTDETVVDGVGNDIFIQEAGAAGETAGIYVSSDLINFIFLGIAKDDTSTAFDLSSIGFLGAVQAIKIVGWDSFGGSPGFDVVNVQVLPGSIGQPPRNVSEPSALLLLMSGLLMVFARRKAC